MNLEGEWSPTTPLMGLGLACSCYENFCQYNGKGENQNVRILTNSQKLEKLNFN